MVKFDALLIRLVVRKVVAEHESSPPTLGLAHNRSTKTIDAISPVPTTLVTTSANRVPRTV